MAQEHSKQVAGAPPKPLQSTVLKAVVFLAGAVLMGFEIVGSRMLAPRFGNDIFVWGSLIGIFLAALSLGYFLGGFAADRWPRHGMLAVLLGIAGVLIIITPSFAGRLAVEISDAELGPRLGPLVACVLIFAVPSILIGMVSPWAIRLETRAVARSGRVAGVLYAISTLGSIAGTFAAAFLLIGLFDVSNIVRILGGVLIVAAAAQLVTARLKDAAKAAIIIVIGGAAWILPDASSLDLYDDDKILLEEDSIYNHIAVIFNRPGDPKNKKNRFQDFDIFNYEECDRYFLIFDNYLESAIYDLPEKNYPSACRYTDLLHFPFPVAEKPENIKRVCVIGGGGGVVPRQYLTDYEWVEHVDLVEIDPRVVEIAEEYFHLYDYPGHDPENPKLVAHVCDGREFFRKYPDRKYDLIVLDAFGLGGRIPFHLLTREYLEEVRSHLNPGGMVALNIISSLDGKRSRFFKAVAKTLEAVFPPDAGDKSRLYVFPRWEYLRHEIQLREAERAPFVDKPVFDRRRVINIILVALSSGKLRSKGVLSHRLEKRAKRNIWREQYRLGYHLEQYLPPGKRGIEKSTPILTDEFAPVESLRYN